MNETPEQIKERILAEELGKGSDPRVAEGRAKAAEVRARHGLPIDPEQAWKALMDQEGRAPAPAAAGVAAATEPATAPEAAAPSEAPEAPPEAPPPEAPDAQAKPIESAVTSVSADDSIPAPAGAEPAAALAPEEEFEPEIGDLIEVEREELEEFAGIRVGDPRLPVWLLVILVAIGLWAIFYLAAFSSSEDVARTTGCRVEPGRAFTCFEK